jgi:hypothetical protein
MLPGWATQLDGLRFEKHLAAQQNRQAARARHTLGGNSVWRAIGGPKAARQKLSHGDLGDNVVNATARASNKLSFSVAASNPGFDKKLPLEATETRRCFERLAVSCRIRYHNRVGAPPLAIPQWNTVSENWIPLIPSFHLARRSQDNRTRRRLERRRVRPDRGRQNRRSN